MPHEVARLVYMVALEKIASDVVEGITPRFPAQLVTWQRAHTVVKYLRSYSKISQNVCPKLTS
jgi:hypothetical protein